MPESKLDKEVEVEVELEEEEEEEEDFFYAQEKNPKDPLFVLQQRRYEYNSDLSCFQDKEKLKDEMLGIVTDHNMVSYYGALCEQFGWSEDAKLLDQMNTKNAKEIKAREEDLSVAKEGFVSSYVNEALQKMCDMYYTMGDQTSFLKYQKMCLEKPIENEGKLDLHLQRIRLGLACYNNASVLVSFSHAHELLKKHVDWERRIRLNVYEALYLVSVRKWSEATVLLLDSIPTFNAHEVVTFKTFLFITLVVSLVALDRPTLKKKIIGCSEVEMILSDLPSCRELLHALHLCAYEHVFLALRKLGEEMQQNVLLAPHVSYAYRELRIRYFTQFLESYRSVALTSMATAFKITVKALVHQLDMFIASGRLPCEIDKGCGRVYTINVNPIHDCYRQLMQKGDRLMERIQKMIHIASS